MASDGGELEGPAVRRQWGMLLIGPVYALGWARLREEA